MENHLKKITLFITALSLIASLSLQAAQAPTQPFMHEPQAIFYQTTSEGLKISLTPEGAPIHLLNIMTKPIGENDEDMTIKIFMKTAHKSYRPFCFTLCRNADGELAIALTDDNLHLLTDFPTGSTPLEKFKLYAGGKGVRTSPDYIFQQIQPTVLIQHVPVQVPIHIPYLVDRPYPVDRVVTIPYRLIKETPLAAPTNLSAAPITLLIQSSQSIPECNKATQDLQAIPATMEQKEPNIEVAKKSAEDKQARKIAKQQRTLQDRIDKAALLLQEKIVQEQEAEQAKKDAAQKASKHKQEKAQQERALEVAKKSKEEEDAQLRKIQQEKAKKITEEQRAEQAKKDREASAALKKATAATLTTPTPSALGNKKGKAAKDDDEAFLKEAMAENTAIAKAALIQKALAEKALAEKTIAEATALIATISLKPAPELAYPAKASGSNQAGPAEEEIILLREINVEMEKNNYIMAKKLIKTINPNHLQYSIASMNIYLNQISLLTKDEIKNLMISAYKFTKDESVNYEDRCFLYFGLAIYTKNPIIKESLLDKCIELDRNKIHRRARSLKQKMVLERYDLTNPLCKTCSPELCLHTKALLDVLSLEADGNFFRELLLLKITFLVKAILAPNSCLQLTSTMKSLTIDPRKTLIENYDIQVRGSEHTTEQLAEINSLIPADIIPADKLHRLE